MIMHSVVYSAPRGLPRGRCASIVAVILATGLALGASGCVLPLNVKEAGSPDVLGILRHSDGTPAVGARVAITHDYDDASCSRAIARGYSDSTGRFRFAATTIVERWIVLFPPIERFFNTYRLCVATDSGLVPAYEGRVDLGYREGSKPDSLRCLDWLWQGSTRVVCTEPNDTLTVQGGGHWTDARGHGFYRLIVARGGPTMKNSGAYLQWVQRNDSGPPELVRETLALPLAPRLVNIEKASLEISPSGIPCVAVESSGRPAHWYSWGPVMLNDARELGAPGQTQPVKACFWDR